MNYGRTKKSYLKGGRSHESGFQHKHALGQNFLTDAALLGSLIDATGVGENDDILEVGPGGGDMTRQLVARCHTVTAVEIDKDLLPILRVSFEKNDNFTLIEGNILRVNIPEIMQAHSPFHVVANIPYYLTTDLMEILLNGKMPLRSINVMVQKEAAEKLIAKPSTPEYCPLAIRAQYYAMPRIARIVEAACFTPPPKVDSAFVCMPMREKPAVDVRDEAMFFRLVNTAFGLRRKTLSNNLIASFHLTRDQAVSWLNRAGLPEGIRGEALSLQQFADLANAYLPPEA